MLYCDFHSVQVLFTFFDFFKKKLNPPPIEEKQNNDTGTLQLYWGESFFGIRVFHNNVDICQMGL